MITSPEVQECDGQAKRLVHGYAIEGEVAFVVRTTGNPRRPIAVIGGDHPPAKVAALLRLAADVVDDL